MVIAETPAPQVRPLDWSPAPPAGSRRPPITRKVLEEVRRLEARALARFGGDPIMEAKPIDPERIARIRALHAEGRSNAEVAAAVGCSASTVSKYSSSNRLAGAAAEKIQGREHGSNGDAGLEVLERVRARADAHWEKLPVDEKLRLLLGD
jgi:hypothetical protein